MNEDILMERMSMLTPGERDRVAGVLPSRDR